MAFAIIGKYSPTPHSSIHRWLGKLLNTSRETLETKGDPWRPGRNNLDQAETWRPRETTGPQQRPSETIRETPGDQARQLDPSRDPETKGTTEHQQRP